ncbi:hypothetical protein JYT71_00075 [Acidimicrobiaceae bacterium AH-315-P05]|nr:hypothetical protein [Acidimicrobiaceae bacterium AH-315-P05]
MTGDQDGNSTDPSKKMNQIDLEAVSESARWSMTAPPPVSQQQLLHMFADHHGQAPKRLRAVAHLVVDRELLVVRGEHDPAQSAHTCELGDVLLKVDNGRVSGSVLPVVRPTPSAFAATAIDQPSVRSYEGDESGNFALGPLLPGRHRILLDNTHLEIELEVDVPEYSNEN